MNANSWFSSYSQQRSIWFESWFRLHGRYWYSIIDIQLSWFIFFLLLPYAMFRLKTIPLFKISIYIWLYRSICQLIRSLLNQFGRFQVCEEKEGEGRWECRVDPGSLLSNAVAGKRKDIDGPRPCRLENAASTHPSTPRPSYCARKNVRSYSFG